MIRNLNQMTFQPFGTVPRSQGAIREKVGMWHLTVSDMVVYRAGSETRVTCGSGSGVLSVSLEGESWQHFYLDKTACIRQGVYYRLSALVGQATALVDSQQPPEPMGLGTLEELESSRKLWVERIFTLFYQEKEQGFLFPGEAHPMAELTYVDQGELHSVADGKDLLLKQGELVVYGPNQWHMQYADIGVAPRFVTVSFSFRGTELEKLTNRRFTLPRGGGELLKGMLREQERTDEYSDDMILSQLNLLLLGLLRSEAENGGEKLQTGIAARGENEIIRRAQQYISAHIRSRLTVPIVARQVDVSPSYLTALFHKNLQIAPGEYIRRIKLQESKQMIREGNLNFTQIAAQLQYSTVHHFSRQFKEKFGITPTEYAKSLR